MDQEFDKLELKLDLVEINTTATQEHVGEIEQNICNVKEQSAISTVLPHMVLSRQIVIHLIYHIVMFLNSIDQ